METINHECYVDLEVAKLLKEAGFNWELNSRWQDWGGKNSHEFILKTDLFYTDRSAEYDGFHALPAPTLDVAQKWLREVNDMLISTLYTSEGWKAVVTYPKPLPEHIHLEYVFCGDTYEQALEAGIKKALEVVLEKGE